MTVIAGNGTLMAARDLGWTRIAITQVPDTWTDDEARAYAIVDNRTAELARWDSEVLADSLGELTLAGWDLTELGFDGLPPIDGDDDDPPPPPETAHTEPGDIWQLGDHRVLCGSSTDPAAVTRLLDGRSIDLVLTDPPYGVAYQSTRHKAIANDAAADPDLLALLTDALTLSCHHSRPGAPCYVFHADAKRLVFEPAYTAAGWKLHQTLLWVKDALVLGRSDYQPQHEPILYGWKPGARHSWYGGRKRTTVVDSQPDFAALSHSQLVAAVKAVYATSDVQRHPKPRSSQEHPTMKSPGLLSRFVVNSSRKADLVYDPFLGSGSTLIAADRQARTCYGVELEPTYCDVIVRRWQTATGGTATNSRTGQPFPP